MGSAGRVLREQTGGQEFAHPALRTRICTPSTHIKKLGTVVEASTPSSYRINAGQLQ